MTPYITPTEEQFEQLRSAADGGPIVMVNLLRFKPGGAEAYGRYAAAVAPLLEQVGGRIVNTVACRQAVVGPEDERWDVVALVEYPSVQAFLQMVENPDYLATHEHREAGLADSRLILSSPVS
ncbi:MAG TPA: DUF1330 domain-containing protein [Solirubrobacteraceae bacterium]|jgi:uncharacterized protein (DUF1330 family)